MSAEAMALVLALAAAVQSADSPEAVIRRLFLAIYGNDIAAYHEVTTEHPLRARLTNGGRANPDRLRRLTEEPGGLQIRSNRPILYRGQPVEGATMPVGATAFYTAAHGGGPVLVPMIRTADGWKVDVRWWIAGQQMSMSSVPPAPEHLAVRSMLMAMLELNRSRAAGFLTDPHGIDVLFTGAPRYREPSGVLEATVLEMPLVEIGAGEFWPLPSGKIVAGGSTDSRKVLVGLFGPSEMVFVLVRAGGSWRVEPEQYFAVLLR